MRAGIPGGRAGEARSAVRGAKNTLAERTRAGIPGGREGKARSAVRGAKNTLAEGMLASIPSASLLQSGMLQAPSRSPVLAPAITTQELVRSVPC